MKLNQHVGAKTGTQHNHNFVLHTSFLHLPCLPDTNTLLRFPPENEGPEVQIEINLPTLVKDLYSENYKTLIKEIEDDTNR